MLYQSKKDCCGCQACLQICPRQAISMIEDEQGFLYPIINKEKCISCNLCVKVCDFKHYKKEQYQDTSQFYAAYSVKEKSKSASGGIFPVLAKKVLSENGIVAGVCFDENLHLVHKCVENLEDVDKMRDSKYIQSDVNGVYTRIERYIKNGRQVLFTGTPCQAMALRSFFKIKKLDEDKLLICDLVCHGVGSPKIFREYIKLGEKNGRKIVDHKFRSKKNGWRRPREINIYSDGSIDDKSHYSQMYQEIFFGDVCDRPSCYSCPYTNMNRGADITICDCWGIENYKAEMDDNTGISMIIPHSQKGKQVFESIKNDIVWSYVDKQAVLQPQMKEPIAFGENYDLFWKIYKEGGFEKVVRKLYKYGLKYDLVRYIKDKLRPIKNKINKF